MIKQDYIGVLKQNYLKILYVNLETKEHEDVFLKDLDSEKTSYAKDIDKWLLDFADKSFVHDEDIEFYKQNTDIGFLRDYFRKYDEPFRLMYRRLQNQEYKWVEMVMMKSANYTDSEPVVVLYVMDAERYVKPKDLENQGIFDCFNIVTRKKGRRAVEELLTYVSGFYKADDAYVADKSGNIVYEYKSEHIDDLSHIYYAENAVDNKLRLIIINPTRMRDYQLLFRCVSLIIYRILLDDEIEQKYKIEKRQNRIINALSKRFFSIYRVDLTVNEAYIVYAPEYVQNIIGDNRDVNIALELVENNLVHKDYYDRIHEFHDTGKWKELLMNAENISMEFKGANRWSRVVIIVAKRDENKVATEVLYCVQDIEAQKLREAEQDFKLREALRQANEASIAKSRFLSNISHDIRTPMNAIVGFTNLAKENMDNKELVNEYLDEISAAGNHLVSLINDVLDMSHIESGKIELNPDKFDITDILLKVKNIMNMDVKKRNVSMYLDMESVSHKYVLCDEIKVNQILFNIIGNAVKYNKDGGYIKISLKENPSDKEDEGIYEFVIEDNGIGMSKEYLSKIFDTFERERDTLTSGIQGTGLGMPITKGLVDLMGGEIHIDSEKSVGTTCTIRLPFSYVSESDKESFDKNENTEALLLHLKGIKVLLAEDNLVNQKLAEAIFKKLGIHLEIRNNGAEAIKALEEHDSNYYKLVLMDMQMPVMNGIEATVAIRNHEDITVSNTPIIMMTANVFEEDRRKSFNAGANGYVAKPIDVDALVREMTKVI